METFLTGALWRVPWAEKPWVLPLTRGFAQAGRATSERPCMCMHGRGDGDPEGSEAEMRGGRLAGRRGSGRRGRRFLHRPVVGAERRGGLALEVAEVGSCGGIGPGVANRHGFRHGRRGDD